MLDSYSAAINEVFMTAKENLNNSKPDSHSQSEDGKKTYSVQEIASILQISKSKSYEFCKEEHFKIIRIGRIIRISKPPLMNGLKAFCKQVEERTAWRLLLNVKINILWPIIM